jgi:hypothetical protein
LDPCCPGETGSDVGPENIELIEYWMADYRDKDRFLFTLGAKSLKVSLEGRLIFDHGGMNVDAEKGKRKTFRD